MIPNTPAASSAAGRNRRNIPALFILTALEISGDVGWVSLRSTNPTLPYTATQTLLPHRERQPIGPSERYAGRDGLHRLEMGFAVARVVARIDESHRPFHQFHDGDVAGCADLQCAELGSAVDDFRRIDGRHGNHLLQREA